MTDPTTSTAEDFTLFSRPGASIAARTSARIGPIIPAALFVFTLLTTCMMGARFAANFALGTSPLTDATQLVPINWILQEPARLWLGLPFSLTVMGILLAHELGHYFACRRNNVDATLPYFIPAPTLSGTAGAIIRLRTRVQDRRALLDIGASGPLWGFAVAAPLAFLGILLSHPGGQNAAHTILVLNSPIFHLLNGVVRLAYPDWPPITSLQPHPVLLASWIGMFVTFLNLLPAGQLDGGHILYAIAPRAHGVISRITAGVLLVCGIFFWLGWILWAVLLMMPFMRHPRVPIEPAPSAGAGWIAFFAYALLALTMLPEPFSGASLLHLLVH